MSSSATMSARQLTLTIPLISDNIVDHLSAEDVQNCITVSKEFHQAFVPYNWRSIHISQRSSYNSLHDNILASEAQFLTETQSKIRTLSSIYPETWDLFLQQTDAPSDSLDTSEPIPHYIPRAPFANLTTLHALSCAKSAAPCINSNYTHQLHTVIEHSPRLRELKIIDYYTKMQLIQLSRIIREHPSLKDLTIQTEDMHLSQYKKLLWASWNLEKLDIITSFYNWPKLSTEAYQTDEEEQELDQWLADNRPHVLAAATVDSNRSDGNNNGKVFFQLKEFYIYTKRYLNDFGITLPFLRRCRRLERLRPPRIESEHLLEEIKAEIPKCWPNIEHFDMSNCDPNRQNGEAIDAGLLAAFVSPKSHRELTSLVLAPHHASQTLQMIHRQYASTLVNLDLRGCYGISGSGLHAILSSCTNLRSFLALTEVLSPEPKRFATFKGDPVLESLDMEYSTDWKCLNLETLHLKIRNGGMSCAEDKCNRAGIPRALFYQIQKLDRMRDLRLCLVKPTWEDSGEGKGSPYLREWESTVDMWAETNMKDALKAFGDLEELETLELQGLGGYINGSLNAAKHHWPKLKCVRYD
ncbi:hypothetical protein BGZ59_005536 [Podila verticillata]|nr:hypothetical protein BGZ59_005536 [Podila verticillata]